MNKNYRFGFTLAEILITIAVIGIVAAITIPALITNYQKRMTVSKLKVAYSKFTQIIENSKLENGDIEAWDFTLSNSEFVQKYIIPYINGGATEISRYSIRNTGDEVTNYNSFYNLNYFYVMNNGIIFFYMYDNNTLFGHMIIVDLNGNKLPNKLGRDIFVFQLNLDKNKLQFWGDEKTRTALTVPGPPNIPCSKTIVNWHRGYYGIACGALIKLDGWKMSKDYPW